MIYLKHDPDADRVTYVVTPVEDKFAYKVGMIRGLSIGLLVGFIIGMAVW